MLGHGASPRRCQGFDDDCAWRPETGLGARIPGASKVYPRNAVQRAWPIPPLTAGAALFDPYFFSFGTTCTHHGLTEQAFAEVYMACQERRRGFA
jgi:hypothetical protein